MTTLRYGIVGAGYFGKELGRIIHGMPGAEVAAVHSPHRASELASEIGCDVAASLDDLADAVDVVVVASPNDVHVEPVLRAAAHGAHVFCEKPVALSYPDCDAMVSACEDAGTLFMAGHVMHFMHGVRRAADLIASGEIGEPLVARAVRTGWEDGTAAPGWKKTRARSGGHLYHHIHELDVIQHLIGAPEKASMTGGAVPLAGPRAGDEDAVLFASLVMPGERYATLEWGSVFRVPEHSVTVHGTRGAIRIDLQNVGVSLIRDGRTQTFPLHSSHEEDAARTREYAATASGGGVVYGDPDRRPPGWLRGIMALELDYFHGLATGARAVDPALASLTDGSAARASIATADALTRSMAEGRVVEVSEITGA